MAEFLIYNKDNWMDLPSKDRPDLLGYDNVVRKVNEGPMLEADRSKKLSLMWQKYTSRYQRGDIIEVRKDGAPSGKLETAFLFIDVPELQLGGAWQYVQAIRENDVMIKRRKYHLDITGITKRMTLTGVEFMSRLKVKSG